MDDPKELIQRAQAGDVTAIGQLFELYRRYLALLARVQIGQLLQGKVDASDIVQETFLDAHRNFARFRGTTEAELVTWLRQILASLVVEVIHAAQQQRAVAAQALPADGAA